MHIHFVHWRNSTVLNICVYNKENLTTVILIVRWYLETQNYVKLLNFIKSHVNTDCKIPLIL